MHDEEEYFGLETEGGRAAVIKRCIDEMKAKVNAAAPIQTTRIVGRPGLRKCLDKFQIFEDPELEEMELAAHQFISEMQSLSNKRWLTLLGPSGVGKTFLGGIIYDRARQMQNISCHSTMMFGEQKVKWAHFVNAVLAQKKKWLSDGAHQANLLWIDDLELTGNSAATDLLEEVLEARSGKWTMISSPMTPDQLDAVSETILARMMHGGSIVLEIEAGPYLDRKLGSLAVSS